MAFVNDANGVDGINITVQTDAGTVFSGTDWNYSTVWVYSASAFPEIAFATKATYSTTLVDTRTLAGEDGLAVSVPASKGTIFSGSNWDFASKWIYSDSEFPEIAFANKATYSTSIVDTRTLAGDDGLGVSVADSKLKASYPNFNFTDVWSIVDGFTLPELKIFQPNNGVIKGIVKVDNTLTSGVTVKAIDSSGKVYLAVSDSSGNYVIPNLVTTNEYLVVADYVVNGKRYIATSDKVTPQVEV